jgi:2-polyprenyl-3-methyl-5-hydroxy-6-metoxy-1,4-benzoquinol methylase
MADKLISQTKLKVENGQSVWPDDDLERVNCCPVCGKEERKLLHAGLTDRVFFCAPGNWDLFSCIDCGSAFLDPCPTAESISQAYQSYLTHDGDLGFSTLGFLVKLRRRLANGYRNRTFGTRDFPASSFGVLAAAMLPAGKAVLDASMRNLPKLQGGGRLLDLGCGNGAFLSRARSAGWSVVGVDFDPKAVEAARSQGLDIRQGGVEVLDPAAERFDAITLAHVIEHVHEPVAVLDACFHLLKPGGFLWLETPNIESNGHKMYGRNWRGLEPPRHLVIFSERGIRYALEKAGFVAGEIQPLRPLCNYMFPASAAIEQNLDWYAGQTVRVPPTKIRRGEAIAKRDSRQREFITIKVWKEG